MIMLMDAFNQRNSGRCVDDLSVGQKIGHEIFQSGAADDNDFGRLYIPYLIYIQSVVVETGNVFGDQLGDRQTGTLADAGCELVNRQGGRGNLRSRLCGPAT